MVHRRLGRAVDHRGRIAARRAPPRLPLVDDAARALLHHDRRACFMPSITERTSVAIAASKPSTGTVSMPPTGAGPPALLNRQSSRPHFETGRRVDHRLDVGFPRRRPSRTRTCPAQRRLECAVAELLGGGRSPEPWRPPDENLDGTPADAAGGAVTMVILPSSLPTTPLSSSQPLLLGEVAEACPSPPPFLGREGAGYDTPPPTRRSR